MGSEPPNWFCRINLRRKAIPNLATHYFGNNEKRRSTTTTRGSAAKEENTRAGATKVLEIYSDAYSDFAIRSVGGKKHVAQIRGTDSTSNFMLSM